MAEIGVALIGTGDVADLHAAAVAACPNASASLFTGAKLSHLNLLPQGEAELKERTLKMVAQLREEVDALRKRIGDRGRTPLEGGEETR